MRIGELRWVLLQGELHNREGPEQGEDWGPSRRRQGAHELLPLLALQEGAASHNACLLFFRLLFLSLSLLYFNVVSLLRRRTWGAQQNDRWQRGPAHAPSADEQLNDSQRRFSLELRCAQSRVWLFAAASERYFFLVCSGVSCSLLVSLLICVSVSLTH